MLNVRNNPLEVRIASKIINAGTSQWVTEKRFGEENDKS
jgi:hypothetical protein